MNKSEVEQVSLMSVMGIQILLGKWVSTHVIFCLLKTGPLGWANTPYAVFERLYVSQITYTADHFRMSFL